MKQPLERALHVRYVKLHFTARFLESSILPVHKVSALRGGMGEMLLRMNCIRDRKCEDCDFETECLVRRMMYSKFEKKPAFVTSGESIGYVLECEDYRENFEQGEELSFHLILFGKVIVHLNHYIQAFCMLGMEGIGKYHARFQITAITNTRGEPLLKDGTIYMEKCEVLTLADYVKYRSNQIAQKGLENTLVFKTPLALKYRGEFLEEFRIDAILEACLRRIYMLDCYEGIEEDVSKLNVSKLNVSKLNMPELEVPEFFKIPEIVTQKAHNVQVKRYSSKQQSKMLLHGIEGQLVLKSMEEEMLPILLAGELTHIGKNSRFGFGRFRVK